MGWTISPPDGASIDANTGVATFSKNEGDSDSAYTITYTDSDGCTATTTFTVQTSPTCVGCDAGVSVSTNVDGDSTEHTTDSIGSYIVDSSRISYSGGLGWAIALFNNNKIKIKFYENTGNARNGDVIITLDGKTCKTIHVSQSAPEPPTPTVAYYLYGNFEVSCDGYNPNVQEMEQRLPYSAFTSNGTFISASTTEDTVDMGYPYIIGCYDGVDARVIRNGVTGATLEDAVPGIVQLTGSCNCLYTITYRLNYTSTSITATIVSIDGDANFDQSEMSRTIRINPTGDTSGVLCNHCEQLDISLAQILNWKVGDVIYQCSDSSMCAYTGLTITNDIDHLSIIQATTPTCEMSSRVYKYKVDGFKNLNDFEIACGDASFVLDDICCSVGGYSPIEPFRGWFEFGISDNDEVSSDKFRVWINIDDYTFDTFNTVTKSSGGFESGVTYNFYRSEDCEENIFKMINFPNTIDFFKGSNKIELVKDSQEGENTNVAEIVYKGGGYTLTITVSMSTMYLFSLSIIQEAPTPTCTCNDFSASKNSVSFGSEGGSGTVTFSKTGDCTGNLTSLTVSTNDSWITPTFNNSHDTLTIAVDTYSDYDTNRTGHTVVSYGDCNVVNIEVVQEKATPGACTCSDLRVGSSPAAIAATGGSATVTWEFTGSCTSILVTPSIPASETSWCHVTTGNGVFNITVDNYPYSSGVTDRSAIVTPLLGENEVPCTSGEFTVTQSAPEPPTCTCSDFSASTASLSFGAGADSSDVRFSKTGTCTGNLTSLTPSTNDSWITPTFNSSHDTLTIAVDTYSDYKTNRTGHTVVSYGDCNVVNIEVVQEKATPGACTCNDFSASTYSVGFGSDSGTTAVNWSHPATCSGDVSGTSDQNWCTVTSENGEFTIKVDKYEYQSGAQTRTAYITPTMNGSSCTDKKIEVTQTPPSPVACTCDDLSVGSSPDDIPATGGSAEVTWSLPSTCQGTVGVSSDESWCHVTTASTSQGNVFNITVYNYPYSAEVTDRTATITPTVGGVDCTTKEFTVTQLAPEPPACTCDDFSASTTSVSFTSNGGSSDVTFSKTGTCSGSLSDLTFTSSDSWITTAYTASTGVLRVSASPIFDKCSGKTGSITVSYNGNPCNDLTITVEQSRVPCTCNAVNFSSTATIGADGGNATFGNVATQGCGCQVSFVSSDDSWLTASVTSSGLTATATQPTQSQRTGTITVYVNGNPCGTCTITQSAPEPPTPTCDCDGISLVATNPYTFDATGGTITAATVTSPCTVSDFTLEDVPSWITTGESGNDITLTAPNNEGDAKDSATINFKVNGSTTSCTSLTVSQEAKAICNCDSFSITPDTQSKVWEYNEYGSLKKIRWIISPDCMTPTLDNKEDFTMTVNTGMLGKVINVYPKQQNDGYTTKTGNIVITGWDGTNKCTPLGGMLLVRQKGQTPSPEEGIVVNVTVAAYTDEVQYEHPSWAYAYYSTSDGNDIPFEILVRPLISIQQDGHPCEPAITWQQKAAFWDNNQYPDPNYHTDVWPAGSGQKICSIKIDTVWANGSEVTNRQTITVSGQKYTLMWISL